MEHMCVAMQSHKKLFFEALHGNQNIKLVPCTHVNFTVFRVKQLELDLTAGVYEGGGSWSGCIMAGSES